MSWLYQYSPLPFHRKNDFLNRKKMEFYFFFKSLQFLMVQGYLNQNITFLGEKL